MRKLLLTLLGVLILGGLVLATQRADATHSAPRPPQDIRTHLAPKPHDALAQARRDPCFFGEQEWLDWYYGARWDDSLSHVQNYYAGGCLGVWECDASPDCSYGTWNGHPVRLRVWARRDGGWSQVEFAKYDNAPMWRAHKAAGTFNQYGAGTSVHEW